MFRRKKIPNVNDSLIGKIVEAKRKYINENEALVEISFQIPYHDWRILKKSNLWFQVERQLQEIESKYIRKSH